jgi:peptidoglycan LD-endopeptidase LytH
MIRTHVVTFVAGALTGALVAFQYRPRAPEITRPAYAMESKAVANQPSMRAATESDDQAVLLNRRLTMPIPNTRPTDIRDTFLEARGSGKAHEATDILAPQNTPVVAIGDGTIRKLFLSNPGGNTIYEFDPEEIYCYYYAHLDHYATGLHEGMIVKRGETIGYVGNTGDARNGPPHLHFAITRLPPDKHWWQGRYIDPYPILLKLTR